MAASTSKAPSLARLLDRAGPPAGGATTASPGDAPAPTGTNTRPNGVHVIVNFDWISLRLGNNRTLTVSRSGIKSTGVVPEAVFQAWRVATLVDKKGTLLERVHHFADELSTLWPAWNAAADLSSLQPGVTRGALGKGTQKRGYTLVALPSRAGGLCQIRFDGDSFNTKVAADLVVRSVVHSGNE